MSKASDRRRRNRVKDRGVRQNTNGSLKRASTRTGFAEVSDIESVLQSPVFYRRSEPVRSRPSRRYTPLPENDQVRSRNPDRNQRNSNSSKKGATLYKTVGVQAALRRDARHVDGEENRKEDNAKANADDCQSRPNSNTSKGGRSKSFVPWCNKRK